MPRKPSYDRDVLIDRAQDLFWRKGWAAVSMKDLEAALGIGTGSFYAAFGSKEALYALALDRYAEQNAVQLARLSEGVEPIEALKAYVLSMAEGGETAGRACMLAKTLLELGPQGNALADRAASHLARSEERFVALFEIARARGDLHSRHDPARLARRLHSDLLGLVVSAERPDVDARVLAGGIAESLDALTAG